MDKPIPVEEADPLVLFDAVMLCLEEGDFEGAVTTLTLFANVNPAFRDMVEAEDISALVARYQAH